MPNYTQPSFNLMVNIWRHGNVVTNPPDVVSPAQLRYPGAKPSGQWELTTTWPFLATAMFPANTDVRDGFCPSGQDTIEVPAGSGRYYLVGYVDDVGKGFVNEHRYAAIVKTGTWPQPIT